MSVSDLRSWFGRPRTSSGLANPYLSARRTLNAHASAEVVSGRLSLITAMLALLVALVAVGGVIHIASQTKITPLVVQVDQLGRTSVLGVPTAVGEPPEAVQRAMAAEFVEQSRLVTPDIGLQRRAVLRVYALLAPSDPATQKINEWLSETAPSNPFVRAETSMVSTEIQAILEIQPDLQPGMERSQRTWQVDWLETTRDRQGMPGGPPVPMRALVTLYASEPTSSTTEEDLRANPFSLYVRDFSWSPIASGLTMRESAR